jgi:hypothetical protein
MLDFLIASVDQVMLLDKRNKKYFKSVALGIQSGIILLPLEVLKVILIPFVKETAWVCYIFFNVVLDFTDFLEDLGLKMTKNRRFFCNRLVLHFKT